MLFVDTSIHRVCLETRSTCFASGKLPSVAQFTNELDAYDFIAEFATAGPKNYGYQTKEGKAECKVRGFRLNARDQEQLNFEVLYDNVLEEIQHPLDKYREVPVWNPYKIVSDNTGKKLYTHTEIKRYQLVFYERVVNPMIFPYGFEQFEMTEEDEDNLGILIQL